MISRNLSHFQISVSVSVCLCLSVCLPLSLYKYKTVCRVQESVTHTNMTCFIIKLHFVGISQADLAGLEKAPRWAKIWGKSFQNQDMLGLCYTFST